MIAELLEEFKYVNIMKEIWENYVYKVGTYVYVNVETGNFEVAIKTEENKMALEPLRDRMEMDYRSQLHSVNKAVDSKKLILSNNYLSFIVKGQNISRLTETSIDNYYNSFLNPKPAKTKAETALRELTKYNCGEIDIDKLEFAKNWIKENIDSFAEDKGYVCIYFKYPRRLYINEELRYLIEHAFLNNAETVFDENNNILGVQPNNVTLNAKKPFLKNTSRKVEIPHLSTLKETIKIIRIFDLLKCFALAKRNCIYIDTNTKELLALKISNFPDKDMHGYFMYVDISNRGEVIVKDFDQCFFRVSL